MTIKRKTFKKYRNFIRSCGFVSSCDLFVESENQEDKQLSPASKTFYKTDSQGKDDYVLMKTGNINQLTIGAYQGVKLFLFIMLWFIWIKRKGKQ